MKQFANCYYEKVTNILNDCLKESRFPNLMKVAEISTVFKKLENTSKDNYPPSGVTESNLEQVCF